jgi:tRNA (guanine37-N1)-methyltransferase
VSFSATILTLYPDMFPGPLGMSLSGDALARGVWSLEAKNIRDHGLGRHRTVDDTPAGGGPGMVIRCDVLAAAIDANVSADDPRPKLLMSPRGKPLTQNYIRELAAGPGAVIICGRFEGVDERVIENRLEYPHYTRPREWEGRPIPDVLLSGNHAMIERWRREESERITRERRPDLLES